MNILKITLLLFILTPLSCIASHHNKLNVLIVDGQNNHDWVATTPVLKAMLEKSDKFTVTVSTSPAAAPKKPKGKDKKNEQKKIEWEKAMEAYNKIDHDALWKKWEPNFSQYDVVISNYNGKPWPDRVNKSFEKYMSNGGNFVCYHAADNAFSSWKAYNEIIGLGGWGGRNPSTGPMLRLRDGKWKRLPEPDNKKGGTHGKRSPFVLENRAPTHAIMKGLPEKWQHGADECYGCMRGPANNITVLASAYSDPKTNGTGEIEPVILALSYGKGRVFHTMLGHDVNAINHPSFQTTFLRGTEWAASGEVTIPAAKLE